MRVLITGGSGFIGSNLALYYRERGHEVITLSKEATAAETENAQELRASGVEVVVGSVTDAGLVAQCCRGAALVHHVAAAMREASVPDRVFWDVNVGATRTLLDACRREGVKRFVYCSSIGAIGKTPDKPADERSPCRPRDIYQVTKKAAEDLCLEYHRREGPPVSVVRPADVYGPRDRRLLKLFRGLKRGRFAMIGKGDNEHHMVYIDDLVQGMALAAGTDQAVGQVFILAGEAPVTVRELVSILARELGVRPPRLNLPLGPVRVAALLAELVCRPLRIEPPIYRRRVDFFRSDYAFDISKAKRVLGYRPRFDMIEGVHRTREWYDRRALL
jgi:nucleoside-diphosphate-sugar epimerase